MWERETNKFTLTNKESIKIQSSQLYSIVYKYERKKEEKKRNTIHTIIQYMRKKEISRISTTYFT